MTKHQNVKRPRGPRRAAPKPTLRALARRLECSHSSLSEQIHRGDFTQGVRIDKNGRAEVTDVELAIAGYNGRAIVNPGLYAVIYDRDGYDWTGRALLDAYDAYELLVSVLVRKLVGGKKSAPDLETELLEESQLHAGFGTETVAYAGRVLASVMHRIQHPEEYVDDDEGEP